MQRRGNPSCFKSPIVNSTDESTTGRVTFVNNVKHIPRGQDRCKGSHSILKLPCSIQPVKTIKNIYLPIQGNYSEVVSRLCLLLLTERKVTMLATAKKKRGRPLMLFKHATRGRPKESILRVFFFQLKYSRARHVLKECQGRDITITEYFDSLVSKDIDLKSQQEK